MDTRQAIIDRLNTARALANPAQVDALTAERARAIARISALEEMEKVTPLSREQLLELADVRNRRKRATVNLSELEREIRKQGQEVAHLERLLNSDDLLAAARDAWRSASDAQIQGIKAAEAARAALAKLKAAKAEEDTKIAAAQTAQRQAILEDLGFGDKTDGPTAATAAKALTTAEARADAIKTALPRAEAAVAAADDALVSCDKATRDAEQQILDAKAARAELAHAIALESYRAALVEMHGALLAATGLDGQRVVLYGDESRRQFEQVAQRLKAEAEAGE